MRPRNLDEFIGQQHFLGEGKLLRKLVTADRLGSVIFFGPPGTGKTTLARIVAGETKRRFEQLSAIMHGVKDLRAVLGRARDELASGGRGTLLFIDEIHRFNKAQQDALLADVEDGVVTLIGATTSNPFFAVNGALVSRSQVFQFEPLDEDNIRTLVGRALGDEQRGLGQQNITIDDPAMTYLAKTCDGDARKALSVLETAVIAATEAGQDAIHIDADAMKMAVGRRAVQYDPTGDEHYDCASALIKSIRGSDPDAGLYWLARMLEGGEDIRFICRRLIILASEDIGNADPHALPLDDGLCSPKRARKLVCPLQYCCLKRLTVTCLALRQIKPAAITHMCRCPVTFVKIGIVCNQCPTCLRDAHYDAAAEPWQPAVDVSITRQSKTMAFRAQVL
ncbi:UNVERIFIED_CONTAM: hypothetical protein GTU68_038395 [Idotea baltica]|nr:hypothetical protein [Idotea baltica]